MDVSKEVFGLVNGLFTQCSLHDNAGPFAISPTVHRWRGDSLPQVIASEDNPSLDFFVRHVQDSGYKGGDIVHPARHNALHWMGKHISYDVDEDLKDPFC